MNPVPAISIVLAGEPAMNVVGFTEPITGVFVGALTVRLAVAERPVPGPGFVAVTASVPVVA